VRISQNCTRCRSRCLKAVGAHRHKTFADQDHRELGGDLPRPGALGRPSALRVSTKEIHHSGRELAEARIAATITTMHRCHKYCVTYFQALLAQAKRQAVHPETGPEIVHRPGNPMLRYAAVNAGDHEAVPDLTPSTRENLDL
jgi:hypothetical protein